MKKQIAAALVALTLAGCSPAAQSTPAPTPTPTPSRTPVSASLVTEHSLANSMEAKKGDDCVITKDLQPYWNATIPIKDQSGEQVGTAKTDKGIVTEVVTIGGKTGQAKCVFRITGSVDPGRGPYVFFINGKQTDPVQESGLSATTFSLYVGE